GGCDYRLNLLDRVVRGYLEELGGRFITHEIRDPVYGLTLSRIVGGVHHRQAELRRIPGFRNDLYGLIVALGACRDGSGGAHTPRLDTLEHLCAEIFNRGPRPVRRRGRGSR